MPGSLGQYGCLIVIIGMVAAGFWNAKSFDRAHDDRGKAANGNCVQAFNSRVGCVKWSPDGRSLVCASQSGDDRLGSVVLHGLSLAGEKQYVDVAGEQVSALEYASSGHLLVGTFMGHLWWIDTASGDRTTLADLTSKAGITSASLSHNESFAAATSDDGCLMLVRVAAHAISRPGASAEPDDPNSTGGVAVAPVVLAQDRECSPCGVRFSDADDLLIWSPCAGVVRVWDLRAGRVVQTIEAGGRQWTTALFLTGAEHFVSAGLNRTIRVWDIATGQVTFKSPLQSFGVTTLALSSDGTSLAWAGHGPKVCVWNIERERIEFEIKTPMSLVCDVAYSPDSRSLAVVGRDPAIRIYDATTGAECRKIDANPTNPEP